MKIPRPMQKLIESFERLPGIGPKTAQRLTFHLLHFPQEEIQKFADSLLGIKKEIKLCSECKNVSEGDLCDVCADDARDRRTVAVVAGPLDVFALEKTGYEGLYHVLHGIIDPLNNIGPEEIFIEDLIVRVEKMLTGSNRTENLPEVELILATNMSMEGEATAMYIAKMLRDRGAAFESLKITRNARGLPVGGDIEYADDVTLSRAIEGRSAY